MAVKFTRMYAKIPVLAELAPASRLIQVVRDPRAVATSYLFGKGHRRRDEMSDPDKFFGAVSDWTAWSSLHFSDYLLARPEYADLHLCHDFERILLLWRHTFQETRRGAEAAYGQRYRLVRNEELRAHPVETMRELYAFLERPFPDEVARLAVAAVRADQEIVAPADPRWQEAYARLGLEQAVREAGFG